MSSFAIRSGLVGRARVPRVSSVCEGYIAGTVSRTGLSAVLVVFTKFLTRNIYGLHRRVRGLQCTSAGYIGIRERQGWLLGKSNSVEVDLPLHAEPRRRSVLW